MCGGGVKAALEDLKVCLIKCAVEVLCMCRVLYNILHIHRTHRTFRFIFINTERSNRLNGPSVSFVCLTAFWQNGGKTIE